MASEVFHFKKFSISQQGAAHLVGTDGVLLGAWADVRGCTRVLDIGTGTGIIALMIAQRAQDAFVTGIDIHKPSVECATRNFGASPWADRLSAAEQSLQELAVSSSGKFDLIVSNPPFFSEQTRSPDPERSLGRHTATLSQGEMLESVARLLAPGGRFCVILPIREGLLLRELSVLKRLYCNVEVQVHTGNFKPAERMMMEFSTNPYRFEKSNLLLKDNDGEMSGAFRELTCDFYATKKT